MMSKPLNREKQAVLLLLVIIAVVVITLRFSCTPAPEVTVPDGGVNVETSVAADTAAVVKEKPDRRHRRAAGKVSDSNVRKQPQRRPSSPLQHPVKRTDR